MNERMMMPVVVGAMAGYLIGKNNMSAVIGGVVGYLWRNQKDQRNIQHAQMLTEQSGGGSSQAQLVVNEDAF